MFGRVKRGMSRTRQKFTERMNVLLDRGPDVDDEFWDGLEEALILADVGAPAAMEIVEDMRDEATRHALPDAYAVMDALSDHIAQKFATSDVNLFDENPVCVLFVGINGAGKTTTVGKIAAEAHAKGRNVLLGSADTFRAAAIEQLEEWGRRADVEIVERERGADPASVCYDTIERAEQKGSDLVLIDTAGRLHTSDDLMRELQKVVNVVRKRANMPVKTVLVIDATTGQNGLEQAKKFDAALDLDGLIITKLDGTAKGGIALAVSHQLGLPIAKVGVGEGLEDLQDFDARDFAAALIGAEPDDENGEADSGNGEQDPSAEPAGAGEREAATGDVEEPGSQDTVEGEAEAGQNAAGSLESEEEQPGVAAEPEPEQPSAQAEDSAPADDGEAASTDDEEEPEHKEGRFKRMFKWRGRKKRKED